MSSRLKFSAIVLLMLIAALLACGPTTPAPTPPPVIQGETPPMPTSKPEQPIPTPTALSIQPPASEGWLVFANAVEDSVFSDGLWIVRPDGSDLRALVRDQLIVGANELADSISPDGRYLAYITTTDTDTLLWLRGLTLHILALPNGESVADIPLTSPEIEPGPNAEFGDPIIEATRAITDVPSLAWSPDGTRLAFVGVMDGPSADLYLYSLDDGSITRLTDGPSQGYQPMWSPDGRYILHTGVEGFGTGAGYSMAGVWAAQADGSEVLPLYTPNSGGEEFVGWVTNTTFLVHSWQADCGPQALRTFDIETGRSQVLWEGCFEMAYSPESSTALIVISSSLADFAPDLQQGIYLIRLDDGETVRLSDLSASQPAWSSAAGAYFAQTETGAVEILPSGEVISLPAPTFSTPIVSSDGTLWAWANTNFWDTVAGLWVGPVGQTPPDQVFDSPVYYALWSSDSQWLMFFDEQGLYTMARTDLSPRLVAAGLRPSWHGVVALP
jgi:WD40 repeat protein